MTAPTTAQKKAWLPLSPRGVAAFAEAPAGRLLFVQLVFAILAAGAIGFCLWFDWYPAIDRAIRHLPPQGEIRGGQLVWSQESPELLSANGFLALSVDLKHQGAVRSPADIQVEFGRYDVWVLSLFGYTAWAYPNGWIVAFNRTELDPWWGAWCPPVLWLIMGAIVVGLMMCWAVLAAIYSWAVRLVGFFADRGFDSRKSWKVAGAALMPGALFMSAAIVLYALSVLNLVALMAAVVAHFLVGWVYLLTSPFFSPRSAAASRRKGNPFAKR